MQNTPKKIVVEANEPIRQVGETIQAIRKCSRVSQVELGEILKLHQSAVSRIESGQQSLSPMEIWQVAQYFGVSIDDLIAGTVNYWAVAEKFGQRPPLPARYRELPFSKVRDILPLLLLMNKTKSHDYTNKLLAKLGVGNLLFANPDMTIGTHLEMDLFRHAIENGILSKKNLSKLIDLTRLDTVHGALAPIYRAQTSSLNLIQSVVLNASHYESNFDYAIERVDNVALEISVTPREHMKEVMYKDDVMSDMLCEYRKEQLANFPRYIDQKPVKLEERECQYHGHSKCIYRIQVA